MTYDRPEDGGAAPAWPEEDSPDLIAGRYELGRLIGSGATACVYRGVDRRLGREVAIKVYDRHVVAVEQLRRARERTVQAGIDHPGVVALFDSGTHHGRLYLVMQLVDGENLAERLLAGPLPADEVSELGIRLADALAYVHARRVVHRDLKPANVLLGPGGPLIGDFGIAHELDSTHITGTGLVTGTAAYLAPEQVVGEPAGPPADVYALGLVLLECLTGEREYLGTVAESAVARLNRPARIPAGTPDSLAYTLRRMTAREPADRPSAEQVPQLLRGHPTEVLSGSVPVTASARNRRLVAAAGGLVTAAVLAVVLTGPDAPADAPARPPAAQPAVPSTSAPAAGPASDVLVASAGARPAPSGVAAAAAPNRVPPGPDGGAGPGGGKAAGKVKGKNNGKGKNRNEP